MGLFSNSNKKENKRGKDELNARKYKNFEDFHNAEGHGLSWSRAESKEYYDKHKNKKK